MLSRSALRRSLGFLPPLAFLALFLLRPLWGVVARSLAGVDPLAVLGATLAHPFYGGRLAFSLYEALLSTLLTLLVGLPAAYVLSVVDLPGRRALRAAVTVPFVLPPILVALGLLALLGPNGAARGPLALLGLGDVPFVNTLAAILVAHVFYNVALVVRIVGSAWAHLDPRVDEVARTLGASGLQRLRRVTLPLLLPSILAASLLVFLFTFTSFGVILILAGEFQFYTVEATVWYLTRAFRLEIAATLALVQGGFTLVAMTLYARLQERTSRALPLTSEAHVQQVGGRGRPAVLGAGLLVVALVLAPLLALVERSLRTVDGYGLAHYTDLLAAGQGIATLVAPLTALRNSLLYASSTALLAVLLGGLAAVPLAAGRGRWRSLADGGLMLPLGVSAVTLGLGLTLTYGRLAIDPLVGAGLIVAAHVLIAYPFATRILLAAARALPPGLQDAARSLGARPRERFRRVTLPLLAPALAVAGVFAFAVSMGEFGAALVLRRPDTATLPVAIYEFFSRPGARNLGRALAMSTVLMLVNLLAFLLIERLRPPGSEF